VAEETGVPALFQDSTDSKTRSLNKRSGGEKDRGGIRVASGKAAGKGGSVTKIETSCCREAGSINLSCGVETKKKKKGAHQARHNRLIRIKRARSMETELSSQACAELSCVGGQANLSGNHDGEAKKEKNPKRVCWWSRLVVAYLLDGRKTKEIKTRLTGKTRLIEGGERSEAVSRCRVGF